jgi:hypothetical protein
MNSLMFLPSLYRDSKRDRGDKLTSHRALCGWQP